MTKADGHAASVPTTEAAHAAGSSAQVSPDVLELGKAKVNVNLTNYKNMQYFGDVGVGKGKQPFSVLFDTGSSKSWVPGTRCKTKTCLQHHRFLDGDLPPNSTTVKGEIQYGTGHVKLDISKESATLTDSDTKQTLVADDCDVGKAYAQSESPFNELPFDGIVGLAPSGAQGSITRALKDKHALDRNVFGVYLSKELDHPGRLSIGGVDPELVAKDAPVHWHTVQSPKEWQIEMKDLIVDGKPMHICDRRPGGVCPAIVDTGSSLVTGPASDIAVLMKAPPAKALNKMAATGDHLSSSSRHSGELTLADKEPKALPVISFRLRDKDGHEVDYPLTQKDYMVKVSTSRQTRRGILDKFLDMARGSDSEEQAVSGFGILDAPGKPWVIGDTFLRRYYSIFDDDNHRVGLVRSVNE